MATDDSTVLALSSRGPSEPPTPDDFEMPRALEKALYEQQRRAQRALAIVELSISRLSDVDGSMSVNECETVVDALEAAAAMLQPVDNLVDTIALMQRGKELMGENANGR
jgi:hypothetical protein